MSKTVAIIGAGPSGLVAAKYLLHAGFKVTIFDSKDRVGGIWPVRKNEGGGIVHPLMVANQSKHTVQFSDLAWEDEGPQFPKAWQVGRYLKRYWERYCKDAELKLNSKVENAEPIVTPGGNGETNTTSWRLFVRSSDGQDTTTTLEADYLVIASGFFARPDTPAGPLQRAGVPLVHSSGYRDLSSLLATTKGQGKKILVVGGQMSGVEVAGTIATHLSSAVNSPGPSPIPHPESYSIHHVIQRPIWVFPLYTSPNPTSPAPSFLPMDLPSYNLSNRASPLVNIQGHISPEAARKFHSNFQRVLGTDQADFSKALAVSQNARENPAYLAVSDTYMDFVRTGLIQVSEGKLDSVSGNVATLVPSGERVDDLAAIVLATGFNASSSLSFLPPSVLDSLSFSPDDQASPVALAFHGTHHPDVPNLGFVGFYRSPYWGLMEMQARFISTAWSSAPSPAMAEPLEKDTSIHRTLALRSDSRMAQFPMGDYAYLMQEFAAALGLEKKPAVGETPPLPPSGKGMDILTPARYTDSDMTAHQEGEVKKSLQQTYDTALGGLAGTAFVAKAIFRSLLGEWKLERDIVSQLPSHPGGHFSGTARFLLRDGTVDGRESGVTATGDDADLGMEYLYIEEGDFKADNGFAFRATRRYVYRYDEHKDKLTVWFVKTDDQKRADYLFHEVNFAKPEDEASGWTATSGHLCIDDFYDVKYHFGFQAVNLKDWRVSYSVKGPKKDYTIDSSYTR